MNDEAEHAIIAAVFAAEGIDPAKAAAVAPAYTTIATALAAAATNATPLVVGICGAQGSGKSTLALALANLLAHAGLPAACLSLDDLYLPAATRDHLAQTIHPLLRTRGVPGTHDVALGLAVFDALADAGAETRSALPRFDKAHDDRRPEPEWPRFRGRPAVILFEGWCVGARPQPASALAHPLNALEREADPDGSWRRAVNAQLAGDYLRLFARLDLLILLQAPDFSHVQTWRGEQEQKLRERLRRAGQDTGKTMDDAQLAHFIQHYERLTRHILAEMPGRADIVVELAAGRAIGAIRLKDHHGVGFRTAEGTKY